jgi:hypothetical protein
LVTKQKGKNLQTSLRFRVLQGGEVLVAKRKGKNLQTSLGFKFYRWGGFGSKVKEKKLTNKCRV